MEKGERVVRIIEQLKQSKHEWAGKKLILSEWQKSYLRNLLVIDPVTGKRKYRRSLLFVPRKNGKSAMISALVVALLLVDGVGLDIVSASGTKQQAGVVFDEAASMIRQLVKQNKKLRGRFKIRDSRKTLYYYSSGQENTPSRFRAITSDTDTNLGGNLTHFIGDEIQTWPDRKFWDILLQSQSNVAEPLAIAIGTAGVFNRNSIGYELYEHAKACAAKPEYDPTFYPCVFEAPGGMKCDFESEEVQKTANPNYGITKTAEYFKEQINIVKTTPSALNSYLCWDLNIWVNSENRFLPIGAWDECGKIPFDKESLKGKLGYWALDLAAVSDLNSLGMVFPLDGGRFAVLTEYWCPRDNAEQRSKQDQVPYLTWANHKEKYIHLTEGNVVDYSAIRRRMNELRHIYPVREVAIDMLFQGASMAQDLQTDGFNVIGFGQGWRSMAAPVKEIETLVMSKKLIHFNNPVLAWNADNCVTLRDAAGNQKLDKDKSRDKIDGMVALAMGLGRAMLHGNQSVLLTGPLSI